MFLRKCLKVSLKRGVVFLGGHDRPIHFHVLCLSVVQGLHVEFEFRLLELLFLLLVELVIGAAQGTSSLGQAKDFYVLQAI